jgi:hypothetical protein
MIKVKIHLVTIRRGFDCSEEPEALRSSNDFSYGFQEGVYVWRFAITLITARMLEVDCPTLYLKWLLRHSHVLLTPYNHIELKIAFPC